MSRIALVTGAASGIGRALSHALALRGDTVVVADINEAGANQVAEEINRLGVGKASGVPLDVTSPEQVAGAVDLVTRDHGRLDLMVNNAGIGAGGPVEALTLADWDRVIDVNLRGVINGVHAAYPVMLGQGHGHILNTASLSGLAPSPFLTPYSATKHAVVGLTLSLRTEAALRGVRVSVLCPGVVDTPLIVANDARSRELLVKSAGRPYPADRLAQDVLRGIDSNRAIIVAPMTAQLVWWLFRASPGLAMRRSSSIVRRLAAQARERA